MILILKKLYNFILLKIVPKKIKKNYTTLSEDYTKEIKDFLLIHYFTNWQEVRKDDLEDHIKNRIFVSRSKVIPWITKNLELKNKKVLEIGSGTGSSSITFAE